MSCRDYRYSNDYLDYYCDSPESRGNTSPNPITEEEMTYCCDSRGNTSPNPITEEEMTDNKGVEHVAKYARLGSLENTIRKPSEQHEEEEKGGSDEMDSEESSDPEPEVDWVPSKRYIPEKSSWISSWFDLCGGAIEEYDEKIRMHLSELPNDQGRKFKIHVDGYYKKDKNPGYGAIICDNRFKPIIVESKVLCEGERVSAFYHELQGVNLGLELAIDYGLLNFIFYCTSLDVANILEDLLVFIKRCSSPSCMEKSESESLLSESQIICDVCLMCRLPVDEKKNEEHVLPVIKDIITKTSELESLGLPFTHLQFSAASRERNQVADCLAKLGVNKKMTPHEIAVRAELTYLLYKDVVDFHRYKWQARALHGLYY